MSSSRSIRLVFAFLLSAYFMSIGLTLQGRGVGLFITHLRAEPRRLFQKAGILELLGPESFQPSVADAMAMIEVRR